MTFPADWEILAPPPGVTAPGRRRGTDRHEAGGFYAPIQSLIALVFPIGLNGYRGFEARMTSRGRNNDRDYHRR